MESRRRRYNDSTRIAAEKNIIDVCNNVAEVRDEELIKGLRSDLNFLLSFAVISAVILTAFIGISMRLLQRSSEDVVVNTVTAITYQLADGTNPPYIKPPFQLPNYAVIVKAFLFTSITLNIVVAHAIVVTLQWLNKHDSRLDIPDPEQRAITRHRRFLTNKNWGMNIERLLAFLQVVVFDFFFFGIVMWTWGINRTSLIVMTGYIGGSFLFMSTTLIAVRSSEYVPFKSPLSLVLRSMIYWAVGPSKSIIALPIKKTRISSGLARAIHPGRPEAFSIDPQRKITSYDHLELIGSIATELATPTTSGSRTFHLLRHLKNCGECLEEVLTRLGPQFKVILEVAIRFWKESNPIYEDADAFINDQVSDIDDMALQDAKLIIYCAARYQYKQGILATKGFTLWLYLSSIWDEITTKVDAIVIYTYLETVEWQLVDGPREDFKFWTFDPSKSRQHSSRMEIYPEIMQKAVIQLCLYISKRGRTDTTVEYLEYLTGALGLYSPYRTWCFDSTTLSYIKRALYSAAFDKPNNDDLEWGTNQFDVNDGKEERIPEDVQVAIAPIIAHMFVHHGQKDNPGHLKATADNLQAMKGILLWEDGRLYQTTQELLSYLETIRGDLPAAGLYAGAADNSHRGQQSKLIDGRLTQFEKEQIWSLLRTCRVADDLSSVVKESWGRTVLFRFVLEHIQLESQDEMEKILPIIWENLKARNLDVPNTISSQSLLVLTSLPEFEQIFQWTLNNRWSTESSQKATMAELLKRMESRLTTSPQDDTSNTAEEIKPTNE